MSATFLIEDVFSIPSRGIVITGTVKSGEISIGMTGYVGGLRTRILSIETFNKNLVTIKEGENCGLLLEGVRKENVRKGEIIIFGEGDEKEF